MNFSISFNGLNGQDAAKLDPLLSPTLGPLMSKVAGSQEISQNLRLDEESHKTAIIGKLTKFEETATLTQRAFLEFAAKGTVNLLEKNMVAIRDLMKLMNMPVDTLEKGLKEFQDEQKVKKTKEVVKAYLVDQIEQKEAVVEAALQGLKNLREKHLTIKKLNV